MTDEVHDPSPTPTVHLEISARQRRLRLVLADLGLSPIVGREWSAEWGGGAVFGALDNGQLDKFLCRLEDILDQLEPVESVPIAGQLTLDLDPVPGPATVVRETSPHIGPAVPCR